jgi:hypothetical protein
MRHVNASIAIVSLALACTGAFAQVTPPASVTAAGVQPSDNRTAAPTSHEDLEPAVNTSATASPDGKPAAEAPAPVPKTAAPVAAAAQPTTEGKPDAAAGRSAAAGKSGKSGKAMDRIELDTTQITGNRELPKVLYIVPWKRSDLGDLTGKPVNSLLDEVLEPVDRDVFKRENRYYRALTPGEGGGSAPAPANTGSVPPR